MKDAIRHLDQRFKTLRPLLAAPRPPKGWVRAIRDAIGMTAVQLAARMGVDQPRITELEKAELSGSITLRSLERAAEALGCRVVYALVPEKPLAEVMKKQAERLAEKKLKSVSQNMSLEDQSVHDRHAQKDMREILKNALLGKPSRLWDEK